MSDIVEQADGNLLWVTINRPSSANALNGAVRDGFVAALKRASEDDAIRTVILTGAGDRVFCAGIDLRNPDELPHDELATWRANVMSDCLRAITEFRKPLIAALNGVAAGGGAMLALLADRTIMIEDRSALVLSEIDVGLPTFPGLAILNDLCGLSLAQDLVLSGRRMGAVEAQTRGLAFAATAKEFEDRVRADAAFYAEKPPVAYALNKQWVMSRRAATLKEAAAESQRRRAEVVASGEPQLYGNRRGGRKSAN